MVVAGCTGGGGSSDPELETALFVVERPDSNDSYADIRFALNYDDSASDVNVEAALDTSQGTVVHDDSTELQWFENFKSGDSEFEDAISGTELEDSDGMDRYTESITADLDDSETVYGRIEDAVQLPEVPYSGQKCTVPELTYSGSNSDVSSDTETRLQMHCGKIWDFPLTTGSFDTDITDTEYNFDPNNRQVSTVDQGTVQFSSDAPFASSNSTLVPEFEHRALPSIAAVERLAQIRARLLDEVSRVIAVDLMNSEDGKVTDDYKDPLANDMWDTAREFVVQGMPYQVDPRSVLLTTGSKFVPLVGAAVAGPPGFAVGMGVSTAAYVATTLHGVHTFAEEKQGDWSADDENPTLGIFDDDVTQTMWNEAIQDHYAPVYVGDDGHTAIYGVIGLMRFQRRYGASALATADDFEAATDSYLTLLDEQEPHVQDYRNAFDNPSLREILDGDGIGGVLDDSDLLDEFYLPYFDHILSLIELEEQIIDDVQNMDPVAESFSETWDAPALEESSSPAWNAGPQDSTGEVAVSQDDQYTAEIVADRDSLRIQTGGDSGTVTTDDEYEVWSVSWSIGGHLRPIELPDSFEHSIAVIDGDNGDLRLSLVRQGGGQVQVVLSGSKISELQTESITLDRETDYTFGLHYDGDDTYAATIESDELNAELETTGGEMSDEARRVRYFTATDGDTVALQHDVLERQISPDTGPF